MMSKKKSLLAVALLVGLVMSAAVYALVPEDVGESMSVLVQDAVYQEIDIDLIKNIDSEMLDLMDSDRNGKVSIKEFTQTGGSDILFKIADMDNNGSLTLTDLNTFSSSAEFEAADGDLISETCQWFEYEGNLYYLCYKCCWAYIGGTWYCICWWG